MEASTDLIARARRALESTAAVALALAPLAAQAVAVAPIDTGDLVVDRSGGYFYNQSGFFSDYHGQPDSDVKAVANADGSTKFYGSVSATSSQFLAHNCYPEWGYCAQDRGVALVWSGTLERPAVAGDRLAVSVDFSVSIPDVGGTWSIGTRLATWNLSESNSLQTGQGSFSESIYEAGIYRIHGTVVSESLQEWQFDPEQPNAPIYWQVFVTNLANTPWSERVPSEIYGRITPYRGVTLTVPDHSIDVAHVDASYSTDGLGLQVSAVPEPGTWLMMALGLGVLGAAGVRRRR